MYVDSLVAAGVAGVVSCASPLASCGDASSSESSSVFCEDLEDGGGIWGHLCQMKLR